MKSKIKLNYDMTNIKLIKIAFLDVFIYPLFTDLACLSFSFISWHVLRYISDKLTADEIGLLDVLVRL